MCIYTYTSESTTSSSWWYYQKVIKNRSFRKSGNSMRRSFMQPACPMIVHINGRPWSESMKWMGIESIRCWGMGVMSTLD